MQMRVNLKSNKALIMFKIKYCFFLLNIFSQKNSTNKKTKCLRLRLCDDATRKKLATILGVWSQGTYYFFKHLAAISGEIIQFQLCKQNLGFYKTNFINKPWICKIVLCQRQSIYMTLTKGSNSVKVKRNITEKNNFKRKYLPPNLKCILKQRGKL